MSFSYVALELYIQPTNLHHRDNLQIVTPSPSWKLPKPSEIAYSKPDEFGIIPLRFSNALDITWYVINWDLPHLFLVYFNSRAHF